MITTASLYLSYELRFAPNMLADLQAERVDVLFWFIPLNLACLAISKHFSILLSYYRLTDAIRTVFSMLLVAFFSLLLNLLSAEDLLPGSISHIRSNAVIMANFTLSTLFLTGFHTFFRLYHERVDQRTRKNLIPTAIIGAGDTGSLLLNEFKVHKNMKMTPVLFIDDDKDKIGRSLGGIRVEGPTSNLERLKNKYNFKQVIIAIPVELNRKRVGEIAELAAKLDLNPTIVPSFSQLSQGGLSALNLRPVELQDLLERTPARLDSAQIAEMIMDKVVLVTGAGGSIGSELCRQIAARNPRLLLLVERCEVLMFKIEQELLQAGYGALVKPLIADINDETRMRKIFGHYEPSVVFHAAAHKHVPLMESQPSEAIKNNSLGSWFLASLASEYKAERFVLISTDKAINPTNAMGASKRMAEILLQALSTKPGNTTRFMAVRFGNVLGSSGSAIPIFKEQIRNGGPVTVTHPEMQRYFMTIPEAVGLVLQCGTLGEGGEIFVLDMGKPIKIVDIARNLIELSGLQPGVDIEIKFVGLRPGEKLFEEIQHEGEHFAETKHESIVRFMPDVFPDYDYGVKTVETLKRATESCSKEELKNLLNQLIPEYKPYLD